jgi:serine protease
MVQPWWRDLEGHGTHVTGTIAASDNNLGVVGVAPNAEIFSVRVFGPNGQYHSSDIVAALEACKSGGAKVISLSLGGPYSNTYEQLTLKSFFEDEGIVVVAAAGNSGKNELLFPAAYSYVISVAAVGSNGKWASFSTRNNMVDVAAPGVDVISTWENGSYASVSGTSMSCPHGKSNVLLPHIRKVFFNILRLF